MAVVGLLLLLSAVGLTVAVALENAASIGVDVLGETITLGSRWLFVAGVATGVVGILGVTMLVRGIARARRRRAVFAEARSNVEGLQAERDRLAKELERERAARTTTERRHGLRTEERSVVIDDDESAVIDLHDDHKLASERHEPAGSGRHGLFHRRQ